MDGIIFHLCVIITLFSTGAAQNCPGNFKQRGDYCYYISRLLSERRTYYQAQDWCFKFGANLASIENREEVDYIFQNSPTYRTNRWIGLDKVHKTDFSWSDGSASRYRYWTREEPDLESSGKCVMQLPSSQECWFRREKINAVSGLMTRPGSANNRDTFNFGLWSNNDIARCESRCRSRTGCKWFTYFGNHPNVTWRYYCVGRSNFRDVQEPDDIATSGYLDDCGGAWRVQQCGERNGFICKMRKGAYSTITAPTTSTIPGYCPSGWHDLGNRCFQLSTDNLTFSEAADKCRQYVNGDLVSIHSQAENAAILKEMKDLDEFWIGMSKSISNQWMWTDNSKKDFTNFGSTSGTYKGAAITTVPGPAGRWYPRSEVTERRYICQRFKDGRVNTPPATTPSSCRGGYIGSGPSCFQLKPLELTQDKAEELCRGDDGFLASIHTGMENAALYLIGQNSLPAWIGLKQVDEEYKWSNGWFESYTNWGIRQPGSNGTCVSMGTDSKWYTMDCNLKLPALCGIQNGHGPTTPGFVPGECPDEEWEEFGGHCYYFRKSNEARLSFDKASDECARKAGRRFNAKLVSIHSRIESDWVFNKMKGGRSHAWIGLSKDPGNDTTLRWKDESPLQFTHWTPGQPSYNSDRNLCIKMYYLTWPGLWATERCTLSLSYVCKAEKLLPPSPPTLPAGVGGSCISSSWVSYGEFCFLFVTNNTLKWNSAQEECSRLSNRAGKLASFDTQSENRFVSSTLRSLKFTDPLWFGLIKEPRADAPWYWFDGSQSSYRNWASGEPNGEERENCAELYPETEEWNDHFCDTKRAYVCKARKQGVTTPSVIPSKGPSTQAAKGTFVPDAIAKVTLTTGYRYAGCADSLIDTSDLFHQSQAESQRPVVIAGAVAGVLGVIILISAAIGLIYTRRQQTGGPTGGIINSSYGQFK